MIGLILGYVVSVSITGDFLFLAIFFLILRHPGLNVSLRSSDARTVIFQCRGSGKSGLVLGQLSVTVTNSQDIQRRREGSSRYVFSRGPAPDWLDSLL